MRKKILAAMMISAVLAIFGAPADAALTTKLKLTIAPHSNVPSHEVSADLLDEHGVFTGSSTETLAFTDTQGRSVTETESEFRNIHGELLMSSDVTITARSDDFTVKSGEVFAETFSVDVTLSLYDQSYNEYEYTLGIEGLPEWLYASGELLSSDTLSMGTSTHHHEFSVSGTPGESFETGTLRFTAVVNVSGDLPPVMRATTSKDVKISADVVPKPPEPVPPLPDPEPESSDPEPESQDIDPVPPDPVPESHDIEPEPPEPEPESHDIGPKPPEPEPEPESHDNTPGHPDPVPESHDIEPEPPEPESHDVGPEPPEPESQDISPDVGPENPNDDEPGNDDTGTKSLADVIKDMTEEEKAAVRTLKIDADITDLKGLEELANLERLDLTGAVSLQSFDLNGNSSVKIVDVSGNEGVKTLSLKGSKVQELDASGCENLEEVDVAGCESLVILDVSNTPITKLDAEDCVNLEVLDCSDCRLVELDITGCDSLNVLDCSNNSLHKLDAYMFTKLNVLTCYNQRITGWRVGTTFNFTDYFGSVSASSVTDDGTENIANLRAWDTDGTEIAAEYDVDTGTARFRTAPAKISYDYITGFNDVMMDVTVFTVTEDPPPGIAGPSGGCDTGLFVSVLALGIFLMKSRKR